MVSKKPVNVKGDKCYIISRINEILNQKLQDISFLRNPPQPSPLTVKDMVDQIKEGVAILNEDVQNTYITSFFRFKSPTPAKPGITMDVFIKLNKEAKEEAGRIKDEVVLGNCKESLALIKAFADKKFI